MKKYDANDIIDYKTAKKFLNEVFGKNWHDYIDVEKLDMSDGSYCIFGQLFGDYRLTHFKFFSNSPTPLDWPFAADTDINWAKKVTKRKAKHRERSK